MHANFTNKKATYCVTLKVLMRHNYIFFSNAIYHNFFNEYGCHGLGSTLVIS